MALGEIVGLVLLVLALLGGLFAVVLGLPGTFIILAASALYSWLTGFQVISIALLVWLLVLALVAEGVEFFAGLWGARRFGGSRGAMLASLLGGILGAFALTPFLFGLGSVPGAFLGAFAGAFIVTYLERRKMAAAWQVGWGALLARVFATVFKGAAAVAMVALDILALLSSAR